MSTKTNIRILKCNAEYGKIYYVEYKGSIRQCKLVRTESEGYGACYVLNIAGIGEARISAKADGLYNNWWNTSQIESVLAASPEDLIRKRYLTDNYGTTANAYNSRFIEPYFPGYSVCGCGGGIYFWKWNGVRPALYQVNGDYSWTIDEDGFHCVLNEMNCERCRTEKECLEKNRKTEVITF